MNRIVITLDGLVASGKSSLSKALAAKLGFAHLNSGLLYRGVGILLSRISTTRPVQDCLKELLVQIASSGLKLRLGDGNSSVLEIEGEDVTTLAHTDDISALASKIAPFSEIRQALFNAQREAFVPFPLVAEGRDMGTVVFPEAQLKIFVETELKERVRRRMQQSFPESCEIETDQRQLLYAKVEREILERDQRDSNRELSPTKAASDAIVVDNSSRPLTEVVEFMYDLALSRALVSSNQSASS